MSLLSDAKATVAKFLVNMGRFDQVMNGDKNTDVVVDVGTVPTLRKLFDYIVANVVGVVIKGSVSTVGDLPTSGNKIGDIYIVTNAGANNAANDGYVWTGSAPWRNIGQIRGPKGDRGDDGPMVGVSPFFEGTPSSRNYSVGNQSSPSGFQDGLIIGSADPTEGGAGAIIRADGKANWITIQPTVNYAPQEFNIYGSQAQGVAKCVEGTNRLIRVNGSPFDPTWAGRLFYWNKSTSRVLAVINQDTISLTTPQGAAIVFGPETYSRYHYIRTTGRGKANINGNVVTRVNGDPFVPFFDPGTDFKFKLGSSEYSITAFNSTSSITIDNPPASQNNIDYEYSFNIYDQISTIRIQKTIGHDEENITFSARAVGEYEARVGIAGAGEYYPFRIKNGDIGGIPKTVTEFDQVVTSIGGIFGSGSFSVFNNPSANRFEIQPSPTNTPVLLRARGSDVNVPMQFDIKGDGYFRWSARETGINYGELNQVGFLLPNDITPPSSNAAGVKGQTCSDANYFYKCVATNTWKRTPLSSW